jgi:hypothetical protein
MDQHVEQFAAVLQALVESVGGEVYETTTFDDAGQPCERVPAAHLELDGRVVNIVPFDVPGDQDHFSIVTSWPADFTLSLRHEVGWDWVRKRLGTVEDHIVGDSSFDKTYLVGGKPADRVISFLQIPAVRGVVEALGTFLALSADNDFLRVTFRLQPDLLYNVEQVHSYVRCLLTLAQRAEG